MEPDTTLQEEPILITPDMLVPLPPVDTRIAFEKGMALVPLFVVLMIVMNVAVYLGELATGALRSSTSIIAAGALQRGLVLQGEYWRLISAAFLHASWGHLLGNSAFLYVLGMANEHAFGMKKGAMIYGVSALAGSLLSISVSPGPSIGASGAVFGLMGSLVVMLFKNRDSFYLRDRNIGYFVGAIAIFQIILGFTNPYVDNYCHIGGFLGGAAAAMWLRPVLLDSERKSAITGKSKGVVVATVTAICCLSFVYMGYTSTLEAVIYREFGKPQSVIAVASRSIDSNPANDYAYFLRGEAYYRQKQYPLALRDFQFYAAGRPDSIESWVIIGQVQHDLKQYEQAIEAYTQALAIRPHASLYNSRGYAYILKGEYKGAQADFLQALKLDKKFAPGYGNLGLLHAINGDFAKAVPLLRTSLKLDKSLIEINKLIEALEYEQKGQSREALSSYTTFVKSTANRSEWLAEFRFAQNRIRQLSR